MEGFIKYMRSDEAINLHSNKNANHLLNVIAFRASRNGNPVLGVKPGEAFIGDYIKMELTHKEYRTATSNLVKWGYITITTTNKGTIAKLCNSDVYNINSELSDRTGANEGQTRGKPGATIKKERKKDTQNDFFDKNQKRKTTQQIRATLYKIFGDDQVHVENIIKGFENTFMISLDEGFVVKERAKFMLLDFSKFKYNKLSTDFEIEDALYKHIHKHYLYSNNKKTTSLRNQNDYEKYLLDWVVSDKGKKKGTSKFNYWEKRGDIAKWIEGYKENKDNLLSIYKEHFKEYTNLTLYTLYDVLYLNVWNKCIKTPGSIPNTIKEFKGWLKRSSKENNYKMNKIHMRTNINDHLDSKRL